MKANINYLNDRFHILGFEDDADGLNQMNENFSEI